MSIHCLLLLLLLVNVCYNLALNRYEYFLGPLICNSGNCTNQNLKPLGRIRSEERFQLLEQVYHSVDVFQKKYKEMECKLFFFVYPNDGGGDMNMSYYYELLVTISLTKNAAMRALFSQLAGERTCH